MPEYALTWDAAIARERCHFAAGNWPRRRRLAGPGKWKGPDRARNFTAPRNEGLPGPRRPGWLENQPSVRQGALEPRPSSDVYLEL
jgi:hypothetical protein